MKTIITPAEAVASAWGSGEYAAPDTVAVADIAAAEERHLLPVIGRPLAEALAAGRYEELRTDYVMPALALFVRAGIQSSLDVRTGQAGTVVQSGTYCAPADTVARQSLHRSLRRRAETLLRRLSDRLEADASCAAPSYPEYDPRRNILKRCMTDGGIVQVF